MQAFRDGVQAHFDGRVRARATRRPLVWEPISQALALQRLAWFTREFSNEALREVHNEALNEVFTYGLDTYGLDTYGSDTYGLDTHGLDTYGLDTYGVDTYGLDTLRLLERNMAPQAVLHCLH